MSRVVAERNHSSIAVSELLALEPTSKRLALPPIVLEQGQMTLGSGADCDIRIDIQGICERHCTIRRTRNSVFVTALDRHTWHNDMPVLAEALLRKGDRLALGPVEFRVRTAEPWDLLPEVHLPEIEPSAPVASFDLSARHSSNANANSTSTSEHLLRQADGPRVIEPMRTQSMAANSSSIPHASHGPTADLLRQIADLESEVARHQSAVARLQQTPSNHTQFGLSADSTTGAQSAAKHQSGQPKITAFTPAARRGEWQPFQLAVPNLGVSKKELEYLQSQLETQRQDLTSWAKELDARFLDLKNREQELASQSADVLQMFNDFVAVESNPSEIEQLALREQNCGTWESRLAERQKRLDDQQATHQQLESRLLREQTQFLASVDARSADLQGREFKLRDVEAETVRLRSALQLESAELTSRRAELGHRLSELTGRENDLTELSRSLQERIAAVHIQGTALTDCEAQLAVREAELAAERSAMQRQLTNVEAQRIDWEDRLASASQHSAILAEQSAELEENRLAFQGQFLRLTAREELLVNQEAKLAAERTELQRKSANLDTQRIELENQSSALTRRMSDQEDQSRQLEARLNAIQEQGHALTAREELLRSQIADISAEQSILQLKSASVDTERTELNARDSDLSRRESDAAEQAARIEERLAALDANVQSLADREAGLTSQAAELTAERSALLLEAQRIETEQTELNAQKQDLNRSESDIAERAAQVDERLTALDDYAETLAVRDAELTSHAADLTTERSTLQLQSHRVEADQAELNAGIAALNRRETDLAEQSAKLEERLTALQELALAVAAREELLASHSADLSAERTELLSNSASLETQRVELEGRIAALSRRETEVADQSSQLELQLISFNEQSQALAVREERNNAQEAELAAERAAAQLLTAKLEAEHQALEVRRSELSLQEANFAEQSEALNQRLVAIQAQTLALTSRETGLANREAALVAERSEIQLQSDDLEAQRMALENRWSAYNVQEADAAQQRQKLDEHQESLQKHALVLDAREGQLTAQKTEFENAQSAASVTSQRLVELRAELESRLADLNLREVTLNEQQSQLHEQQLNLEARLELIQSESSTTASSVGQLEATRVAMAANQASIQFNLARLESERDELAERARILDRRESELADQTQHLESHLAALQYQVELVGQREQQIGRLESELAANRVQEQSNAADIEIQHALELRLQEVAQRERDLERQQQQIQQDQLATWDSVRSRLAIEEIGLHKQLTALQSREVGVANRAVSLEGGQRAIEALTDSIKEQYSSFVLSRDDLERRQSEFEALRRQLEVERGLLPAVSNQQKEFDYQKQAWQEDLEAAQTLLRQRESALNGLQEQLARDRETLERERADWELKCSAADYCGIELQLTQESAQADSSQALETLDRLDDLLQKELELESDDLTFHPPPQFRDLAEPASEVSMFAWNDRLEIAAEQNSQASEDVGHFSNSLPFHDQFDDQTADDFEQHALNSLDTEEILRRARNTDFSDLPEEFAAGSFEAEHRRPELYESLLHDTVPLSQPNLPPLQIPETPSVHLGAGAQLQESAETLRFRAQLSEMFNMDLSAQASSAKDGQASYSEAGDEDQGMNGSQTGFADDYSAAEIDSLGASSLFDLPAPRRSSASWHNESEDLAESIPTYSDLRPDQAEPDPILREDDSVDSYMQRLLARTRRNLGDGEQPASADVPLPGWAKSQTLSKADLLSQPPAESEPEPSHVKYQPVTTYSAADEAASAARPVMQRAPVDFQKVREGIDSLRQVANDSARSAIARSKWKRVRAKFALKIALAIAAWTVGTVILTGKWILKLPVSPIWGYTAIVLAIIMTGGVIADYLWVHRRGRQKEDFESNLEQSLTTDSLE
jgi:chromosome segregation ATPase